MNNIPDKQNLEPNLRFMRARQEVWARATRLLILQIVLTVIFPLAGAAIGLILFNLKPYIAGASILIAILDVAFLDRAQSNRLKLAARIAERFDCAVLTLPENRFITGNPVDHEVIIEASDSWTRRKGTDVKLRDWYPVAVARAPLHLARIICQRANLWYDATLRRSYANVVLALITVLCITLVAAAMIEKMTVENLVVSVLAQAAPVLIWTLREYYRQLDTAEAQDRLKIDSEALWERAVKNECGPDDCLARSREFQDAIFNRRASSPLIFPVIYPILRSKMESRMNLGADALLVEAGYPS